MTSLTAARQAGIGGISARIKQVLAVSILTFLAGCTGIIPDGGQRAQTPAAPPPAASAQEAMHNVALLAPLSGDNADIGRSIANAATLAYIDTNAGNIRLSTYDTAPGAANAARRAIADGNGVILGPLLSDNVDTVAAIARPAGVPIISFSNDSGSAEPGVFLIAQMPSQSVERVTRYAHTQGDRRFAALVPNNVYGNRAADAYRATVQALGATLVGIERYDRSSNAVRDAVARLDAKGDYDALLIGDNGRAAMLVAPIARSNGAGLATFLGTELWNTEAELATAKSLRGALFASVSDRLYGEYSQRYRTRFGATPFRLSTMGYDAALLTVSLAEQWTQLGRFPTGELTDRQGFVGLDGVFRFGNDGMVERTFEVQRIGDGTFVVVDAAASEFPD